MCQMRVILKQNGTEELIMENPSRLTATDGGLTLDALFEEPRFLPGATVSSIDFLQGTVTLSQTERDA